MYISILKPLGSGDCRWLNNCGGCCTLRSLRSSAACTSLRCPSFYRSELRSDIVACLQAVSTGVIRHLRRDDYICSTYRDHVHALSKDVPAREIMAELFGKKTGICRGQGGSMHMFSAKYGLVSCRDRMLSAVSLHPARAPGRLHHGRSSSRYKQYAPSVE